MAMAMCWGPGPGLDENPSAGGQGVPPPRGQPGQQLPSPLNDFLGLYWREGRWELVHLG